VIAQLLRLLEGIANLDRKIEEAAGAHPDFFIFQLFVFVFFLPGTISTLFCRFVLRRCRNCPWAAVVQRVVHFSAHPQVMQQHCQLSCRGYRLSATLSVALFFGLWIAATGGIPESIVRVARPLFFAGALTAGITFVGMEYFLFRFDDSRPLKQVLWFGGMLFPLLGPALYCFIVYSRSHILNGDGKQAKSASP